ncbi:hypothetical protein BH10PSE4_BH10PSE4_16540 [soil metagenome]
MRRLRAGPQIALWGLWFVVPLVALFAAGPTFAASSPEAVARSLVINSAVMRQAYEQRAAAAQFAAFQQLAAKEQQVQLALLQVKSSTRQSSELRTQLADVEAQLQKSVTDLAAKDGQFAIRRSALEAEVRSVVSAASPQKLALLERYASGDRAGAYAAIEDLTYAENRARAAAAEKAEAENLKQLLALNLDLILRGEASIPDRVKILQDVVRLDPTDVNSATQLIGYLSTLKRNEEAADLIDVTEDKITDPWESLDFQASVYSVRTTVRNLSSATKPLTSAFVRVETIAPPDKMDAKHLSMYCVAILELATTTRLNQIYFNDGLKSTAVKCISIESKDEENAYRVIDHIFRIHSALISVRDFKLANLAFEAIKLLDKNIKDQKEFEKYKVYGMAIKFKLFVADSYRFEYLGESIPKDHEFTDREMDEMAALAEKAAGKEFVSQYGRTVFSERGLMLYQVRRVKDARDMLEKAFAVDYGPPPSSARSDLENWLTRGQTGVALARVCLEQHDLPCAERALRDVQIVQDRLQILRPIDDREMFMLNTPPVYSMLMSAALAAARLRLEQGKAEEADRRLLDVVSKLSPYADPRLWHEDWPPFQAAALLLSGEIRGQLGQTEPAKVQLRKALELAEAGAKKEPEYFGWTTDVLQARFRLAQLEGDGAQAAAVQAEVRKLTAAGKMFAPGQAWIKDVATWKRGRPPQWRNSSPAR